MQPIQNTSEETTGYKEVCLTRVLRMLVTARRSSYELHFSEKEMEAQRNDLPAITLLLSYDFPGFLQDQVHALMNGDFQFMSGALMLTWTGSHIESHHLEE